MIPRGDYYPISMSVGLIFAYHLIIELGFPKILFTFEVVAVDGIKTQYETNVFGLIGAL